MPGDDPQRPKPDALLRAARREGRGRLKIFLGAAPGVGKTFEMLREGAQRQAAGVDVVVGVVETHGRSETAALAEPFEIVPRREIAYRGHALTEMDLDGLLARRPQLALVDEFAHSNVEGSRHPKRWQDVMELLDAGIDVYTTLNIQHVESLNDVVASFTRVRVRETVPDSVFEDAEVEVVDLPPAELIERLEQGKVYVPDEASRALGHFFSLPNLSALREMALRRAAQSVDAALIQQLDEGAVPGSWAGGERVIVAVSELPGADAVVRAAKRLADALKAPWQAVHIETPRVRALGEDARRRIAETLRLAATLGATVVALPAETIAEGLGRHVADSRATQLVIGKSSRSRLFELRHGSVVRRLLATLEGVAVHVIPLGRAAPPPSETRRRPQLGRWQDHAAGLGLVAATTLIGRLVEPWIGLAGIDLLFLLPVIIASSRFGLQAGLGAGLAAALAYNFFFLQPLYTFTIADPRSLLALFVLLGLAGFTAHLTGRLRVRATIGVRSAAENAAVAAFGQELARVSDWHTTGTVVCQELSRLLDLRVVLLAEREGTLTEMSSCPDGAILGPVDLAAAEWSWNRGEPAGTGTSTLNAAEWQFHPLRTAMGVLALVGLSRGDGQDPVDADRVVLVQTLLGQAALAHERLRLEAEVREVGLLKERDRLRAALLSSIGHDLRTPLTAVAAAIDGLAASHPDDPQLPLARSEISRLRRFMDNLIDMVRLDSGTLAVNLEPVDLVDSVSGAVHDLRPQLAEIDVRLDVPANLPLVRADPVLLHHILLNLLANAVQHGGRRVRIAGRGTRDGVTLTIGDDGPGLPEGSERKLFDAFARGSGSDRTGGSGLGLAIVKGFADAMGAGVEALNAEQGGAEFTLRLGKA